MTKQEALELANLIKHGAGSSKYNFPLPEPDEAITILKDEYRRCGFNWLTGREAITVLGGKP